MPDRERLTALAATVGTFHITDKTMRSAQDRFETVLAGDILDEAAAAAYLRAVRRYFEPYEREAEGQLRHVDGQLQRLYQLQFNLTAERGVVAKRVEAVRGVLGALAELRGE